jgi:hypothetical protein
MRAGSLGAGSLLLVILRVHPNEVLPLLRGLIEREDGFYRAGWNAGAAIDALIWMDIEHLHGRKLRFVLARMDAVDGTDVDTGTILRPNARLTNDVRH